MVEVSVITPVWNRADLTQGLLYYNWAFYQGRPEVEFVMIDNGSTDATGALLGQWQHRIGERLVAIYNDDNLGFGGGNNQGVKFSNGDTLVFLSNDVCPTGDYITPIVAGLEENPGALIGAEILDWDTGWNKFNGQLISYLAGWMIAARRETWEKLGGWDERFYPCDYEDIDLSHRAVEAGIPLLPLDLPLVHKFGQSAALLEGGRESHTLQNRKRFIEKWGLNV